MTGGGPLYAQVRDLMIERVRRGEWKPGQSIPSETQLASDLEVSQGTVRKAIGELVAGNVLVRRQGKGTFVASHDRRWALFHFFHVVADRGEESPPVSRTLANRRRRATRDEARTLGLSTGDPVVRIERVRLLGGAAVLSETVTVPASRFPGLERLPVADVPNTLYEMYEREHDITIHRADERVKAVNAGARVARQLGIEPGDALLRIERVAFTLSGTPVELRVSFCDTANHHYASSIT